MKLNYSQRSYLYETFKKALSDEFDDLGGKALKEVYGTNTQTLILEAIFTTCYHKNISAKKENGNYIFKITIDVPVLNDKFDLIKEIKQKEFNGIL